MTKQDLKKQIRDVALKSPYTANIKRLALFGSHAREDATPKSDIDLLVEFVEPVGFFTMAQIQRYLEERLGKRIDLVTPNGLSQYIRDEVLASAEPVYEK